MLLELFEPTLTPPGRFQVAFMPRKAEKPADDSLPGIKDGVIEVEEGVSIGYRLYNDAVQKEGGGLPTVLVFHHGNAELAPDMPEQTIQR